MWCYFTAKKNIKRRRYVIVSTAFIHSVHRSIKTAPTNVTVANEKKVWHILSHHEAVKNVKYKFKIGDQVRINKIKRKFEKGSCQIFLERYFL